MKVEKRNPEPFEYCELRRDAGMSERSLRAAEKALRRSLLSVCIRENDGKLVGMGRVVGDLGCHVQIVDIAVSPSHQKRGFAHTIMSEIMRYIRFNASSCAFVNLFADVDFLYHKYGFELPKSTIGMVLNRDAFSKKSKMQL